MLKMALTRSGIAIVLVALSSFVSALQFTQMSSDANDVIAWTGGAQVGQPAVLPGPITEPWVPSKDIAATLERMCSLTCQAGKDEDRKGFCAVYSSLIRVAGAANTGTPPEYDYDYGPWPIEDADMEKAEKKCLNACKKNRKGNNSHKEARNQLCKAYGLKSFKMTKMHTLNTVENLQIQADNQQRECDQEVVQEEWKPEVILTVGGYDNGYTSEMVPAAKGCSLPNLPQETTSNSLVTHIDTNGRKILLTCKSFVISNCHKLDKTNGQTKWTEYNKVPSLLGYTDGRSFINTPKGVYAFGYGGIAFLPKGKKEWTEGPKLPNSNFKLYYSCPVLISDTEIMLLGGAPIASYGKQAWKLNINNSTFSRMPELLIPSQFHGCGIHTPSDDSEPYILSAGPDGCEKYSLDGKTQERVGKLNNNGYNVKLVSLEGKTYAFGADTGKKVEVWNGLGWDMAPQEYQVKTKRYYSGVMAVPKDFVC